MEDQKKFKIVRYRDYLALDKVLEAQVLRSEAVDNKAAHDEMLFIIAHQVYELWFKQINHELSSVLRMFDDDDLDERNIGVAVNRLNRVGEIQQLLIQQIIVLETMTPLDFLEFRQHLFPASGFQSFQFRKMENLLGLKRDQRVMYSNKEYTAEFSEDQKRELENIELHYNLFDAAEGWLERTPFLHFGNFRFVDHYREAVERMLAEQRTDILRSEYLTEEEKEGRLHLLGSMDTYFRIVLDKGYHQQMLEEGNIRLSYEATVAALFINLYREEPILQMPFNLLTALVNIDENFTTWRYRHSQMVLRMLGKKIGTGGSSGHEYLRTTAMRHHIYTDLHNISTLLIPRKDLPDLPPEVQENLGFCYTHFNYD